MTVYNMFTVPIVHYEIKNWDVAKNRILRALPKEDKSQEEPNNGGLFTDYFKEAVAEKTELPDYADVVIDVIKPHLADFSSRRRIEFTDMWYQKYYRGVSHPSHNHGHSGWSAIIYVEFDPEYHTPTEFYNPYLNPWNGNLERFVPPVKEGDMVIFPSTIQHEATANQSDVRRTIVSFNLRGHTDVVKKKLWDGDPIILVPRAEDG